MLNRLKKQMLTDGCLANDRWLGVINALTVSDQKVKYIVCCALLSRPTGPCIQKTDGQHILKRKGFYQNSSVYVQYVSPNYFGILLH